MVDGPVAGYRMIIALGATVTLPKGWHYVNVMHAGNAGTITTFSVSAQDSCIISIKKTL